MDPTRFNTKRQGAYTRYTNSACRGDRTEMCMSSDVLGYLIDQLLFTTYCSLQLTTTIFFHGSHVAIIVSDSMKPNFNGLNLLRIH